MPRSQFNVGLKNSMGPYPVATVSACLGRRSHGQAWQVLLEPLQCQAALSGAPYTKQQWPPVTRQITWPMG
ncbi:hypothetical protein D3C86_1794120 [compost metagenome]